MQIECFGAGGKGSTLTAAPAKGGGGSGGTYARTNSLAVVPTTSYTVQISASNGATTWFSNTGSAPANTSQGCLAVGGNTVANNTAAGASAPSTASNIGNTSFAGGAGAAGGGTGMPGGGGESGSSGGTGDTGSNTAVVNSHAAQGAGAGNWSMFNNGDGPGGGTPGGGGCGAARTSGTRLGGPGGPGQITLTYTVAVSGGFFLAAAGL